MFNNIIQHDMKFFLKSGMHSLQDDPKGALIGTLITSAIINTNFKRHQNTLGDNIGSSDPPATCWTTGNKFRENVL